MAITFPYGLKVVWGVPKALKPITDLPPGKVLLRLRNTKVGEVFVKSATGIQRFALLDNGETWGLMAQSRNERWVSPGRQPD